MSIENFTVYLFMNNIFFLTMHEQNVDLHSLQIFNESQYSTFIVRDNSIKILYYIFQI